MEIKNRFTGEVIHSGDFNSIRDLVIDAVNKGVNLSYANLSYANLEDANLIYANLKDANLIYANLRGVNLSYANLEDANLIYANLEDCVGNRKEIKSLLISDVYPITYTSKYLQIGCERHEISDWWAFDNGRIRRMDGRQALDFWAENKEFIKSAIEKYPAVETRHNQ